MNKNYHFKFSICVVGDSKTGKTAFIKTLEQNCTKLDEEESNNLNLSTFEYKDDQTIYQIVIHVLPPMNNNRLLRYYTNGSEFEIYLFDATRTSSLEYLKPKLEGSDSGKSKILIANKIDIVRDLLNSGKHSNYVKMQNEAFELAREYQCQFIESSLQDPEKNKTLFLKIINDVTRKIPVPPDPIEISKTNIDIGDYLLNNFKFKEMIFNFTDD